MEILSVAMCDRCYEEKRISGCGLLFVPAAADSVQTRMNVRVISWVYGYM